MLFNNIYINNIKGFFNKSEKAALGPLMYKILIIVKKNRFYTSFHPLISGFMKKHSIILVEFTIIIFKTINVVMII